MKKNLFIYFSYILLFILLSVFLLANSFNYLDPDLGWHLRTGQEILDSNETPYAETHNYTLEGKNWIDHEWLLNAISFYLFNSFGYIGLNMFFVLIMLSTFFLLAYFITKLYPLVNAPYTIIFFFIFGALAMAPHLGVRMQEISIFNLLLLLILIFKYDTKVNYKVLFFLFPLFIFWANVHAGFLIGLFVLGFYLMFKILEIFISKSKFFYYIDFSYQKTAKDLWTFFVFFLFSIASTLLTPYGIKLYSFLKTYGDTYYFNKIMEWLPIYAPPFIYYQIIYAALALSLLALHLYSAIYTAKKNNQTKINLWHFSLSILFLLLATKSRRHFPLFFIVSLPLLIGIWKNYLIIPENQLIWLRKNAIIKLFFSAGLLIVIIYYLLATDIKVDPFTDKKFCSQYPCAAIDFLKNNEQYRDLRLFNNYSWGGFHLWVWPEKKLFMDGRLPIAVVNGHSLLEEYNIFFQDNMAKEKLSEYNIEVAMLRKQKMIEHSWIEKYIFGLSQEKTNSEKNHLEEYLKNSADWKNIYEDAVATIYVNNNLK